MGCVNYDILVCLSRDLLDSAAWVALASQVEREAFVGYQSGPVCTTFANVRGLAGGPPPLRGMGKFLYDLPELTTAQRQQVERDALIADRCAWIAMRMREQGKPFAIEQPGVRKGRPHMFQLPSYVALRRLPGGQAGYLRSMPLRAHIRETHVHSHIPD